MIFPLSLLPAILLAGAHASNVQVLNPKNFDSIIGKGKPALVELLVTASMSSALLLIEVYFSLNSYAPWWYDLALVFQYFSLNLEMPTQWTLQGQQASSQIFTKDLIHRTF